MVFTTGSLHRAKAACNGVTCVSNLGFWQNLEADLFTDANVSRHYIAMPMA
jgi:hypothetical protein